VRTKNALRLPPDCAVVSCGRRDTQPFPLSSRMVETRSQPHSKEFQEEGW